MRVMDDLYLYGLIAILIVLVVLREARGSKWRGIDDKLTSYKSRYGAKVYHKRNLLTKPEYGFWAVLKQKCEPHGLLICPKVRIEDFVSVSCSSEKMRQRYRGYVKSRHIDFLLCDGKLNILAGVELDDKSHDRGNVKGVDGLKDDVFRAIHIPLYRIKVKGSYESQIDDMLVGLGFIEKKADADNKTLIFRDEWLLPFGEQKR